MKSLVVILLLASNSWAQNFPRMIELEDLGDKTVVGISVARGLNTNRFEGGVIDAVQLVGNFKKLVEVNAKNGGINIYNLNNEVIFSDQLTPHNQQLLHAALTAANPRCPIDLVIDPKKQEITKIIKRCSQPGSK